jgi:hypothetical protein
MKPKLLLRIAAGIMLLHTAGHTMGALGWKNAPNTAVRQIIAGMEREHFNFMGRLSTLADFYNGYGMMFIFVLLMITWTLWLLSNSNDRRLLWPLTVYLFVQAVLEYIYFFPMAAIISLLAAIASALALYRLNKDEAAA